MDEEQARRIREYNQIPDQRREQLELIGIMGYSKLRGKPLDKCEDWQIYRVAQRLYEQAHSFEEEPNQEKKPIDLETPNWVTRASRIDYINRLRETFPGEPDTPWRELEARLLD